MVWIMRVNYKGEVAPVSKEYRSKVKKRKKNEGRRIKKEDRICGIKENFFQFYW